MVSANNTTEHLPVTPPKTHKKSGCSKGSRFQTGHSMEFGSSQLADSKPERNQQKPHLVDGKLVDKSTKKNPQKAGNSCDWPISKLCPPNQNTFENNQVVSINYYGNKNEHTMSTHSSEQNICEEKIVPKGIPCLKGLKNHGNTCYFNALMQSLAGCDRLAEFLLCKDFDEDNRENGIFDLFLNTIRCMWFNHYNVDNCCHKTIYSIANDNQAFCVGHQHDSHECIIWLLNKLNREILDFNLDGKIGKGSSFDPHIKMIKNNEVSTLLKLFK
uniref:ubiquitinyl hydrolase 1 n=1 Tax=Meloidogyne incognita TaxID=6306 RepID=A0A914M3C4_MELIC